jgi:hypothetical protein
LSFRVTASFIPFYYHLQVAHSTWEKIELYDHVKMLKYHDMNCMGTACFACHMKMVVEETETCTGPKRI